MKVLFLTSGADTPATRYRILPYLPRLQSRGITCHVANSFPSKYETLPAIGFRASQRLKRWTRSWHLLQAKLRHYDAIVIEREIFDDPSWDYEAAFRKVTGRFILDIDDAIFLRYPEKFPQIAGMSDCILAGNRWLAEECEKHSQNVRLLPTCIDLSDYPKISAETAPSRRSADVPVVGWIGTPSNIAYIKPLIPAFEELCRRIPFRLRIVTASRDCVDQLGAESLPVEFISWNASTAVAEIGRFTVGIMPLEDGIWERHKCGFKLLQYMAAGLPAIASPVGVNQEILSHGENGFLAATPEEWTAALEQLLTDNDLRTRLGLAARETVEQRYSVDVHFPTFLAAIEGK